MEASDFKGLLARVKAGISEVAAETIGERLAASSAPLLIDVREATEWQEGHLPGAVHLPRGFLELRIEQLVPDRATELVLYCGGGVRSALAARSLSELGYSAVSSLAGGISRWKGLGLGLERPAVLSERQRQRYARHILLPEVGEAGQRALLSKRVLIIGAGGLGCPVALYLAAAGVGTLVIVDDDVVDETNLQRQILHGEDRVGRPKVDSAAETLRAINSDVRVEAIRERLSPSNALRLMERADVVVDGSDNFATRYLVNDAAVFSGKTVVHGAIFRFEGQLSVFQPGRGPCYRCLFREPPPAALAPSCQEAGVFGVLPGVVGLLQAVETLKLLLGLGKPLIGRLLLYDALAADFRELSVSRDPECPVCGDQPSITDFVAYEEHCRAD